MLPTLRSLALLGLIVATPALAQGPRGGAMMMERALDQIELSADQRTQIDAIKASHRDALQELRGELRTTRVEIGRAIESDADDATVARLARALHSLDGEMRTLRQSAMMEVRGVLTDEQKAEIKALRGERRGERRGEHGVEGEGQRRGGGKGR